MNKLQFDSKLRPSWLVQRLNAPLKPEQPKIDACINALAFGGGLENGGFGKEAIALLGNLFTFDYMGATEFEWGIVPSCFEFLAKNVDKLVAGTVTVDKDLPPVYFICHKLHEEQVRERINLLATNPPASKEFIGLKEYLQNWFERKLKKQICNTVGWLDCSNGFLFFVSPEIWSATCRFFKIKPI